RFDVKKHFPGLDLSIHDCRYPVSLLNFLWQRLKYPPIDKFLPKVDIVHSTYSYYIPTKGKNEIITIHDLFHLKKPELAGVKDVKGEFDLIKNSAERAQRIIAVSEFTKNEIVNILGISDEKIEVIHSAPTLEPELSRLGEKRNNKRTILSVGTLEHRKNHIKLIEAFRMAKKKVKESKLVIVGKEGFGVQEIQRKKSELSLLDDVTFT
ncbi:glycosyltransferase, partial [bacterium]|nr:glycosyltransferase [bacterium]